MFQYPIWTYFYHNLRSLTMKPGVEANSFYAVEGVGPMYSLLNWAIKFNDEEFVDFLIANGANVNLAEEYSEPPLLFASRLGRTNIVRKLLEAGANPNIHWVRR